MAALAPGAAAAPAAADEALLVLPTLPESSATKEDVLWFCCAYLNLADIARLCCVNSALRHALHSRGLFYPVLRVCSRVGYYALPEKAKSAGPQRQRSTSEESATGNGGDGSTIFSRTPYSPGGQVRASTPLDLMRICAPGATAAETPDGLVWLEQCPWRVQRKWLWRIRGLQRLRVEVGGPRGIEPASLARVLWNNRRSLYHIEILWREPLQNRRTACVAADVYGWWSTVFKEPENCDVESEGALGGGTDDGHFALSRRPLVGKTRHGDTARGGRPTLKVRRGTASHATLLAVLQKEEEEQDGGSADRGSSQYHHSNSFWGGGPRARHVLLRRLRLRTHAPRGTRVVPRSERRTACYQDLSGSLSRSSSCCSNRQGGRRTASASSAGSVASRLGSARKRVLSVTPSSTSVNNAANLFATNGHSSSSSSARPPTQRRLFRWRRLDTFLARPSIKSAAPDSEDEAEVPVLNLRLEEFKVRGMSPLKTELPPEIESLPPVKFPRARHVAIQLENQYMAFFFHQCSFPACRRILIEELNPTYFPSDDSLPNLLPLALRKELRTLRNLQDLQEQQREQERQKLSKPPLESGAVNSLVSGVTVSVAVATDERLLIPAAILRSGLGVFPEIDLRHLTGHMSERELHSVEGCLRRVRKLFATAASAATPSSAPAAPAAPAPAAPDFSEEEAATLHRAAKLLRQLHRIEPWESRKLARLLWAYSHVAAAGCVDAALELALSQELEHTRYLSWDLTRPTFSAVPLFDGNHLIAWRSVLASLSGAKEIHLLVGGRDQHLAHVPRHLPREVRRLLQHALNHSSRTVEWLSTLSPAACSQTLLDVFQNRKLSPAVADAPDKPPRFGRLDTVECCDSTIDLSTFSLNTLLHLPRVQWVGRAILIAASVDLKDSRLQPPYRPSSSEATALLERLFLRLLAPTVTKCTLRAITAPFAKTFQDGQWATQQSAARHAAEELKAAAMSSSEQRAVTAFLSHSGGPATAVLPHRDLVVAMRREAGGDLSVTASKALIPPRAAFPRLLWLVVQSPKYFACYEEKMRRRQVPRNASAPRFPRLTPETVTITTAHATEHFARVALVLERSALGNFWKTLGLRTKPRLRVTIEPTAPVSLFATLPKFHTSTENPALINVVLHSRRSSHQLRGLLGSVPDLVRALQTARSALEWRKPVLKCVEVIVHNTMVRCLCSISPVLEEVRHFRALTEFRIRPRKLPAFLTVEELFASQSPEAQLVSQMLSHLGFERDPLAELELFSLTQQPTFVFTRPWSFRRQYLRLPPKMPSRAFDDEEEVYYAGKASEEFPGSSGTAASDKRRRRSIVLL